MDHCISSFITNVMTRMACHQTLIFFQLLAMPLPIKSLGNASTMITKTIMATGLDSQGMPLLMMDIFIINGIFGINLFGMCIMDRCMLPFMLVFRLRPKLIDFEVMIYL